MYIFTGVSEPSPPAVQPDVLLDTYFSRCHGKAYYILDETSTRQRMQLNQIPSYLVFAIYAVSARYDSQPNMLVKLEAYVPADIRRIRTVTMPQCDSVKTM